MAGVYLITGGAGNLACQLTHQLFSSSGHIVLIDVARHPMASVADGCVYMRCDLAAAGEIERILSECRPEVIIHFASLLSGSSESDRRRAWAVNADVSFALFEAAVRYGVRQVFFPSSVAAYGGSLPDPVPEDFPQWPMSLYGATKVAVERLGVYYHAKHGLDFRSIRLPVVISRYAPAGAASAYASRAFVETVAEGRYTFRVDEQTRPSLIYVKDVLRAIVKLLDAPGSSLTRRVYNIQALSPTAADIAQAIQQREPAARLTFDSDPEITALIDGWPICFDDAAARHDWGWRPDYDLPALADDFLGELRA